MTQHTPTPWYVMGDDEPIDGIPMIEIMYGECPSPECETVCYVNCDIVDDEHVLTDKNRADADFICLAVNCHDELLDALDDLHITIAATAIKYESELAGLQRAADKARAAIRKAKGLAV